MKKIRKQAITTKTTYNFLKNNNKFIAIPLLILGLALMLSLSMGNVSAADPGSDNLSVQLHNSTTNGTAAPETNTSNNNQTGPDPDVIRGGVVVYSTSSIGDALNWPGLQDGDEIMLENGATFYEHDLVIPGNIRSLSIDVWNEAHNDIGGHATIDAQHLGRIFTIQVGQQIYLHGLTLTNGNTPSGDGGAILDNGGRLLINSCIFSNNTADNGGAIFYNYIGTSMANLTLWFSTFTDNTADNGGAIYFSNHDIEYHELLINSCTFTNNIADNGGAIYNARDNVVYGQAKISIADSDFTNNSATSLGGAIYTTGLGNVIGDCRFTDNTAGWGGGAIFQYTLYGDSDIQIGFSPWDPVSFTGNKVTENPQPGLPYGGGAIENYSSHYNGNIYLNNDTFTQNTSIDIGGAICNRAALGGTANAYINNSTFTQNSAAIFGGAIGNTVPANGTINVYLTSNTFEGNNATSSGGAIYNDSPYVSATVNFNRIVGNTAPQGDAIYTSGPTDATNNWWGSNTDPTTVQNKIIGTVNAATWVILSINASPTTINNSETSAITADLKHINGGGSLTGGQIPDGIPVSFTVNPSWGSITDINPASSTTLNGQIEATYQANGALPVQTPVRVYANVDNEHTVYAEININKPTTLTINSPHGYNGDTVDITATLTETGTTTGIANEPITITVNGQNYTGNTNGSGQVTWSYFINNMIPQNYPITANFAGDGQYMASNGQGTLTVNPKADITVTKVVNPGNANTNVGHSFNYTITATNNGPNTATGVQITDIIPSDLTFNNYTTSQGTYNNLTGIWDIGTLINGASVWLNLNVTVKPSAAGKTIANTAYKSLENEYDPTPADDSATAYIYVPKADIGVNKYTSKSNVSIGEVFYYTIAVNNAGPDAATGVQITDLTPSTLNFLSYDTHGTGTYNPTTGIWNIGTIGNGMTDYLTIYASPKASAAGTTITNTATKTAENEYSSIPGVGSVNIHVIMADISVNKTISNPNPNVGDTFNYTITATNNGTDTATNLSIYDFISGVLTVNSINTSQGTYDPATRLWTIGTLANGATASMIINVTVKTSAAGHYIVNTAYKYAEDQYDPTTIDDMSTLNTYVNPTAWTVTIIQLENAATYVKTYYETHSSTLPVNVKIGYDTVSMPQFLQLLVTGTLNINNGNFNPINVPNVNNPISPSGSNTPGNLQKPEYLTVANSIKNFINTNGRAPNYMSTSLGNINYTKLVYMYSKIVNFYQINTRLPNYVTI